MSVDTEPSLEGRLERLESRMAHFERVSDDLSDVVARQAAAIDQLQRRVAALTDRVLDLQDGQQRAPSDEKPPPHY